MKGFAGLEFAMSGSSHLSKEFFDLVKAIGESRSKQEEDKIVTREVSELKQVGSTRCTFILSPKLPARSLSRTISILVIVHCFSITLIGSGYIHASSRLL